MTMIKIPYGSTSLELCTDGLNIKGVLISGSHDFKVSVTEEEIVRNALSHPIDSKKLSELAVRKQKVVIVTSDHTRTVPSKLTLPLLLGEIRKGSQNAEVKILIGTGLHRKTTLAEQRRMFGDAIVDHETVLVHDAFNTEEMCEVGVLPSGNRLEVNKNIIDCDLLVTEGFIEPHFFAGFSGGRKSILPGVSSEKTIKGNHCFRQLENANAATAILAENPVNLDMEYAARKVNVQFTLNVALDERKKIIAAFAGDIINSHKIGCEFVKDLSKVDAVMGDIVITSNGGYPLDQNLYQCPKAVASAEVCVKEGGIIILVAACEDGIGGTFFEELMLSGKPPEVLKKLSALSAAETVPEQWCAQKLCQTLLKYKIILVTTHIDPEIIKKANLIPASSIEEALSIALQQKGKDAEVVVVPDGVSAIPMRKEGE